MHAEHVAAVEKRLPLLVEKERRAMDSLGGRATRRYCAPSVDFPTPDGPSMSVHVPIGTPLSSSLSIRQAAVERLCRQRPALVGLFSSRGEDPHAAGLNPEVVKAANATPHRAA